MICVHKQSKCVLKIEFYTLLKINIMLYIKQNKRIGFDLKSCVCVV